MFKCCFFVQFCEADHILWSFNPLFIPFSSKILFYSVK
ncbi:hypothetical protein F544_10690 [Bibersteinia trehalosi USDA-ARS-USMARC-190]|uniref:Uncharacterized protein n=1 Tax=Bibersteinia trehalosi USDA-ARS-USMARC-190 TaxID=1263832 RepID=W0R777_BIBTR|nr:hypothetical protein F544_10690 [Bibersteinia trehalosi USDA-ARS-USMARC-190]